MAHGPVEIVVLAFPGNRFNGAILPELSKLVAGGTVTIIDAVLASTDAEGNVSLLEIEELDDESGGGLAAVVDHVEGLLSDEDVAELLDDLGPNSSAAVLAFEHTWVKPLRDAIYASGGILLDTVRVPGPVVDEVFAAVEATQ